MTSLKSRRSLRWEKEVLEETKLGTAGQTENKFRMKLQYLFSCFSSQKGQTLNTNTSYDGLRAEEEFILLCRGTLMR